jgi:hypothetical protein
MVLPPFCDAPEELIDIVRIKLVHAEGSAVVSDWHAADLLLARWTADRRHECKLGFELLFRDGNSLFGNYVYNPSKKARPVLSKYIKRVFEQLCADFGPQPELHCSFKIFPTDLRRYAIDRS